MRLTINTPLKTFLEENNVAYIRAEDSSGAFGVLPGHADFITPLSASVVTFRAHDGREHHIAVRGGLLEVSHGSAVTVATREAIGGEDLSSLAKDISAWSQCQADEDRSARSNAHRMYLSAIRQIYRTLGGMGAPMPDAELNARTPGADR